MKAETDSIGRNELAVLLAYEAEALTERQASDLLGYGADVVAFRGRREYILAEVARLAQPGGLPNFEQPGPASGRVFQD